VTVIDFQCDLSLFGLNEGWVLRGSDISHQQNLPAAVVLGRAFKGAMRSPQHHRCPQQPNSSADIVLQCDIFYTGQVSRLPGQTAKLLTAFAFAFSFGNYCNPTRLINSVKTDPSMLGVNGEKSDRPQIRHGRVERAISTERYL
jgi:hypothetical protein